jgi:alpha-galactosidase
MSREFIRRPHAIGWIRRLACRTRSNGFRLWQRVSNAFGVSAANSFGGFFIRRPLQIDTSSAPRYNTPCRLPQQGTANPHREESSMNPQPPKVAIIGAGSASFGLGTLSTLLRNPRLHGGTLGLVDLDAGGLSLVDALARRLNREWDAGLTIISSTRREEVLPGADFVIVSIEVGPREGLWLRDWEIPLEFGVRQPYGENGGPGGLAHTLRQVPAMLDIARDMERLCPDAWLINFSNPVPRLCLAVSRYSKIQTVGLCHQIKIAYMMVGVALAERFGIDVPPGVSSNAHPEIWPLAGYVARQVGPLVDIKAAGLNHFTWILDVRDRRTGEDLYPAFRRAFMALPTEFEPLTRDVFKATGLCPVPGDSHLAEYLPWCHDPQARPWEKYELYLYDWDRARAEREEQWQAIEAMAQGRAPVEGLREVHSEGAVEIIEGIRGGEEIYRPAVNIPNQGHIANLPDGAIVEVPALVGGWGIRGLNVGPLPEMVAELCRREIAVAGLAVDAAVSGDRQTALQALLLDPCIDDIDTGRAILAAYLSEYAEYLPQFG